MRCDLREAAVSVQVVSAPTAVSGAETKLKLTNDNGAGARIMLAEGILRFQRQAASAYEDAGAWVPYDASAHRYWRLRETAGTTYWETSPDGASWTTRASGPDPLDMRAVRVVLSAYVEGSATAPGFAEFDDLDGGDPTAARWCPVATLRDDFAGGSSEPLWGESYADPGFVLSAASGRVLVAVPSGQIGAARYRSSLAYDLTGSSAHLRVEPSLDPATGAWADLSLESVSSGGEHRLTIALSEGKLFFTFRTAGGTQAAGVDVPYLPLAHRHWRIREAAGFVYWETSADGLSWTARASRLAPFGLQDMQVRFGAGTTVAAAASPGEVVFDDFNEL